MKTIVQLLIVVLIVNACVQAGRAYYRFYDFKDRVQEEVHHGHEATASELRQQVAELAGEYGIALDPDDIDVTRDGDDTVLEFAYVDEIPLVPKVYSRPWTFEGTVSARRVRVLKFDDLTR